MGILLEGFALFSLVVRLIIVMVTISGCIRLLWGCCVCFKLPLGHCVSYRAMFMGFSPGCGLMFVIWHQHSWLGGGHYAKKYDLWLLVLGVCISIGIVINWFGS
jgi:hypothetical protein